MACGDSVRLAGAATPAANHVIVAALPPGAPYAGQGPVDDLMVREVGIRICLAGVGEPLASWSSRSRAASRPMSYCGMRSVVSAYRHHSTKGMSL